MPVGQLLTTMATKVGPVALKTVQAVWPVIAADPEARRRALDFLDRAQRARRGGKVESLRRSVDVLREQALRNEAAAADPATKHQAGEWVRQTESLSGAIALLAVRAGAQRKADIRRLEQRIDGLFAEMFSAAVRDDGDGHGQDRAGDVPGAEAKPTNP